MEYRLEGGRDLEAGPCVAVPLRPPACVADPPVLLVGAADGEVKVAAGRQTIRRGYLNRNKYERA